MSDKESVKMLAEFQLCCYDVMKYIDIHESNYRMKILFEAFVQLVSIRSGMNFRYGLTNIEKYKDVKKCLICNKNFENIDVCRTPSCEHLFHATCICSLENKETKELKCPICKTNIDDYLLPFDKFNPDFYDNNSKNIDIQ